MNTLEKIRNTVKSFDGRIRQLEKDPNIDLKVFCDRTSSLEHEAFEAIKRLIEKDEKENKENVSSIEMARRFGLLDYKD